MLFLRGIRHLPPLDCSPRAYAAYASRSPRAALAQPAPLAPLGPPSHGLRFAAWRRSALQEVTLPAGAPLLRRGESWDALYIVCSGSIEDGRFQANKKVKVKGNLGGSSQGKEP